MAVISCSTHWREPDRRPVGFWRIAMRRRYSALECLEGIARQAGLVVILLAAAIPSGTINTGAPRLTRHTIRVVIPSTSINTGAPRLTRYTIRAVIPSTSSERVAISRLAGRWTPDVMTAAHRYDVSATLVASVLHEENRGHINDCAHRVSPAGAIGPLQLMPGTAWNVLRVNPWNPRENILGGTRYLAQLIRRYHGDVRSALMAYNAGPTAVDDGHVPVASIRYASDIMHWTKRVAELRSRAPARIFTTHGVIAM